MKTPYISIHIGLGALLLFTGISAAEKNNEFHKSYREKPAIGEEVAVPEHLEDGDEYVLPTNELVNFGKLLFEARWTAQEGGGRPLTKGTGGALTDPAHPLVFPDNFNRVSAPDANACSGCHNLPISGAGGDIVANVFVAAQRFDFATFDHNDLTPTRGAVNELLEFVQLGDIGNSRATLGMSGSGYIEMLARQMTEDLQAIRDGIAPSGSAPLVSKGVSFGTLERDAGGAWITSAVEGLPAPSLANSGPSSPPSLVIMPFHQSGSVVSLRQFTNNAFNHHHGIQTVERFGAGTDPDGDGFTDEMTRADVTAASIFQATLPVPGRVIPNNRHIEKAIWKGEKKFESIGCAECHRPSLPLTDNGWVFTEPNPFNPDGNLQPGEAPDLSVDLNSKDLPLPRLRKKKGVVHVPAYTDLKLHDITSGPGDPNAEAIDINQPGGSPGFLGGNTKFLTKKLWGAANEPPYFHHGKFMTLREAILAHAGEAETSRANFEALSDDERNEVIEFLKSLQVLPAGTEHVVVDEKGLPKKWPPRNHH